MTSMRVSMESSNVDDQENHSGKDQASVEEVSISTLHWTALNEEIKLQYSVATAGSTQNLLPGSEPSDYFNLTVKPEFQSLLLC